MITLPSPLLVRLAWACGKQSAGYSVRCVVFVEQISDVQGALSHCSLEHQAAAMADHRDQCGPSRATLGRAATPAHALIQALTAACFSRDQTAPEGGDSQVLSVAILN